MRPGLTVELSSPSLMGLNSLLKKVSFVLFVLLIRDSIFSTFFLGGLTVIFLE